MVFRGDLYKMQTPFMLKCFSTDFSSVILFCPKKFIVFGKNFFLLYVKNDLLKVYFELNVQIVKLFKFNWCKKCTFDAIQNKIMLCKVTKVDYFCNKMSFFCHLLYDRSFKGKDFVV